MYRGPACEVTIDGVDGGRCVKDRRRPDEQASKGGGPKEEGANDQ